MYIWEQSDWPEFRWKEAAVLEPLSNARFQQGAFLGRLRGLGFDLKLEAQLEAMTAEVIKSSEIEGERLEPDSVRSSVARRLGVEQAVTHTTDARTDGIVEMMLDATRNYDRSLTSERLFAWQAALFPTGYSGLHRIETGRWRSGPIQVVSGPIGKERVHYDGPPADRLEAEMARFLDWYANPKSSEGLLRAALAHLWFVTVHPFDDGNGRVARAIADQALAQSEGSGQRFYSMSAQIRKEQDAYYDALERAQKGSLDVTAWLLWFLACFSRAIAGAENDLVFLLRRADLWRRLNEQGLNERQRKVMTRFIDGFEGKLTAKKWAALGKCSIPTANRDLLDLVRHGILIRTTGGSKNTSYEFTPWAASRRQEDKPSC